MKFVFKEQRGRFAYAKITNFNSIRKFTSKQIYLISFVLLVTFFNIEMLNGHF